MADAAAYHKARRDAEALAGEACGDHVATYKDAGYMSDSYVCSCGWKSVVYFDGAEYAYADWVKHIKLSGAVIDYPEFARKTPFRD